LDSTEIDILEILDNHEEISQREISKLSGFSLGKVNILLKKFANKGFVKIEKLNSKNLRYILTPKGFSHLTKKTLGYIKRSYKAVNLLITKVKKLSLKKKYEGKDFFIYGDRDEIYSIITNTLDELDVDFMSIHSVDKTNFAKDKQFIVLYWNPDYIEDIKQAKNYNDNVEFQNILTL
jgi:DNA-binding MarR family transcriptional regulator